MEKLTDQTPHIKWVNDIFLNGKKICGILTEGIINMETQTIESIILGIGINVTISKENIPKNLQEIIGGIFDSQTSEQNITRNQLAAEIMNEFYPLYQEMESKEYLDQYRERCFVLGKEVSFKKNNEELEGKAIAIDDEGGLVIEMEHNEKQTLSYGEISIKIKQ
ncbi:biotin--[acetyl-CoA-carboxylase] ligase [Jeotgalibaca sp. MA1X17-3]|uniref:biotin--[acetyl-CoA-carboxylase] ligase n=1 Tax=Jeotgalibaca sp. MA1X17-3 TaxID=2908211 RepID=UPI00210824F0|nr:biotin--[acetyl-CoA-carboxylase] ligase [Jeotgalibaca sp. MA1X17-3]